MSESEWQERHMILTADFSREKKDPNIERHDRRRFQSLKWQITRERTKNFDEESERKGHNNDLQRKKWETE